jgi:GxxExxY protein
MIHEELTGKIISAFYIVYNGLGYGFLEKVYENALAIELRKKGLIGEQQKRVEVFYDAQRVGDYYADFVVNDCVVLELKAAEVLAPEHEAQLINYLKSTEIEVGLLLNFGPKPQIVRRILTNDRKTSKSTTEDTD